LRHVLRHILRDVLGYVLGVVLGVVFRRVLRVFWHLSVVWYVLVILGHRMHILVVLILIRHFSLENCMNENKILVYENKCVKLNKN